MSRPLRSFSQSGVGEHFRIDGSVVTITIYRACAQKLLTVWASKPRKGLPYTEDTPPESLQQKTVFGIYVYTYICICMTDETQVLLVSKDSDKSVVPVRTIFCPSSNALEGDLHMVEGMTVLESRKCTQ